MKRQLVAVSELVEVDSLLWLLGKVPAAAECECFAGEITERVERSLVETARFRPWWASEGEERVPGNHTSTYRVLQQTHKQAKRAAG